MSYSVSLLFTNQTKQSGAILAYCHKKCSDTVMKLSKLKSHNEKKTVASPKSEKKTKLNVKADPETFHF